MEKRTIVPVEIVREVLIESGHRCAVCGDAIPLERAHIVPWSRAVEHNTSNLICLCANCHFRADSEKWGEEALRKYKERPWILRSQDASAGGAHRVQVKLDIELKDYSDKKLQFLQHALAAFLGLSPDEVSIIEVEEG